jgi:two-component system, NtrC family, response regulator AtoC
VPIKQVSSQTSVTCLGAAVPSCANAAYFRRHLDTPGGSSDTVGGMSVGGQETRTLDHVEGGSDGATSYVIAIDNMSSRTIPVPADGVLQIGRARDAEIQINSEAVSRNHAKLIVAAGRAQIEDLGSHNGTIVNGERIVGSIALNADDVIAIADTLLILRTASKPTSEAIDLDQMTRRIDQEIARATEYDRPFSVVVLRLEGSRPRALVATALATVRPMDVLCFQGTTVIALLPELDAHAGLSHGTALLEALGASVRGGISAYPADGCDTATLLAAARSALGVAQPGKLVVASSTSIEHRIGGNRVIVADAAMLKLYELVRRLARSDISVLVTGETGSGKENAAAALHHWSPRANGPLIALNCAALPETLAESELFGYERGAFSDAKVAKPGLLERAHGGTLFLDEVGDLSLALQAKLLRALEVKKITRLGDVKERDVDVRIVAATNIDLDAAVVAGKFRQDLLFRLSAVVALPPLRHRRQEIPLLARMFVQVESQRLNRAGLELSEGALAELARYNFPGNVRELKNAIDFAVATTEGPMIQSWDLPARITGGVSGEIPIVAQSPRQFRPIVDELRELECKRILEALEACDGVQTKAAAAIGMPLRTFTFRMKQFGIDGRERKR